MSAYWWKNYCDAIIQDTAASTCTPRYYCPRCGAKLALPVSEENPCSYCGDP